MSQQGTRRDPIPFQDQLQIPITEQRRNGCDTLDNPAEVCLPGPIPGNGDMGTDDEADSDSHLAEEGEEGDAAPCAELVDPPEQDDRAATPRLPLSALIGSRLPAVLLRLERTAEGVAVRTCAAPASDEARMALKLLAAFVAQRFDKGRAGLDAAEWEELLGATPDAPLMRRMILLLRLAVEAGEKVSLGEESKAAFTPHDIGLERFAAKFAALPDGTPFSLRLLLLDKRGRERSDTFFDRLPDAVKFLALRKALLRERQEGQAVSDYDFCTSIQKALEELLGFKVERPTEDQVRRRLRDNFKRRGLAHVFPNQRERQQAYLQEAARQKAAEQEEPHQFPPAEERC
jgi:hypothetical protein